MLRDPGAAEDVVQDTFLNAFKGLDKFDGRAALGTWLFRIAYNNALMRLRSRKPTASLETESDEEGLGFSPVVVRWNDQPEEIVERHETAEILDRAIDSLPTSLNAVFQLRDIEQRSTEETAEILGLSQAAVKVRLHRARLALREKLSEYLKLDVPPEAATMTCEQLIPYLSDYIDNSVDEPLATAAREHIATCAHCHVLVDTTRRTITLMQAGKSRIIPAASKTKLFGEIRSAFMERQRGAGTVS
jgi:RNA polymerase sigma-70 factor (ECF subfamily)